VPGRRRAEKKPLIPDPETILKVKSVNLSCNIEYLSAFESFHKACIVIYTECAGFDILLLSLNGGREDHPFGFPTLSVPGLFCPGA
jgi:hypothetical protein